MCSVSGVSRNSLFVVLAFITVWTLGCGKTDPGVYEVSGTVTFNGNPVGDGEILFYPDTQKGNSGRGGYATITNGEFTTMKDRGVVGGPYILEVSALPEGFVESTEDENKNFPSSKYMLFPVQRLNYDLPKENTTLDIVVPAGKK